MSEWLTYKDIANLSGLKIDTIYRHVKRNTLPEAERRIDNKPLWKKSTVEKWIESRKTNIETTN
jgi:predicted DNA-binding transcriptional regulator AlpA